MNKHGEIDFRASGVALDSSSAIYLMKSKLLLKLEDPPMPPKPQLPPDFLPPPLFLPLRYELASTTIQQLLQVLDDVLKTERPFALKRIEPILPPPQILPPIDVYLMEIEKQMDKLLKTMTELADQGKFVAFSKIAAGLNKLETIKTLIVLLFLAQRGDVSLWQDETQNDIYIMLTSDINSIGRNSPKGVV
jgi:chromatin segregation and condensation protein Rec8/ScpA/Scc1 (kleisin family)